VLADPIDTVTSTSAGSGPLVAGATYFWQVVALDGKDTTAGPVWSFGTNLPPEVPRGPWPRDSSDGIAAKVKLQWLGHDPDGDTLTWSVYLGTSSSPDSLLAIVTQRNAVTDSLAPGTTYYWRVVASDGIDSTVGPVWQFTTNNPPKKPYAPSPANADTGVQLVTALSWEGGDPDGDAVSYTVYLDTVVDGGMDSLAVTETPNVTTDSLKPMRVWYWRVVASDGKAQVVGPVWQFTTRAKQSLAPYVPSKPYPADGQLVDTTTLPLSWTGGHPGGAETQYVVSLDTVPTFSGVFRLVSTTSTTVSGLIPGKTYYWQVTAVDASSNASAGPVWSFAVEDTTPVPGGFKVIVSVPMRYLDTAWVPGHATMWYRSWVLRSFRQRLWGYRSVIQCGEVFEYNLSYDYLDSTTVDSLFEPHVIGNAVFVPPGGPVDAYFAYGKAERFTVPVSGTYDFDLTADDECYIWIDGELVGLNTVSCLATVPDTLFEGVCDRTCDYGTSNWTNNKALTAGVHTMEFLYWNHSGGTFVELYWRKPGDAVFTPIPKANFD
jgi:hypothetical protein